MTDRDHLLEQELLDLLAFTSLSGEYADENVLCDALRQQDAWSDLALHEVHLALRRLETRGRAQARVSGGKDLTVWRRG